MCTDSNRVKNATKSILIRYATQYQNIYKYQSKGKKTEWNLNNVI